MSRASMTYECRLPGRLHHVHQRRTLRDVRWRVLLAGLGRVVYGLSEKNLKALIGPKI